MVVVREVIPDDWQTLRDIRLAALREAPYAFGSSYAREAPFTEEQWRGRISDRSVTYLAYLPDSPEPAGLAASTCRTASRMWCPCGCGRPPAATGWARP